LLGEDAQAEPAFAEAGDARLTAKRPNNPQGLFIDGLP
jgi:hypothetical protein